MAKVTLAPAAVDDLRCLIRTHSLPSDTTTRVKRSLRPLERFPQLGPALDVPWDGLRFLVGPWRWMVFVYAYLEADDRVVIVTIQDARSSNAATATRA